MRAEGKEKQIKQMKRETRVGKAATAEEPAPSSRKCKRAENAGKAEVDPTVLSVALKPKQWPRHFRDTVMLSTANAERSPGKIFFLLSEDAILLNRVCPATGLVVKASVP